MSAPTTSSMLNRKALPLPRHSWSVKPRLVVWLSVQDSGNPVNFITETIGLINASNQYEAAAALIRTGDELSRTLIDTFG